MVPLIDLKAQYQSIKTEIAAAIARVLESSQFVLGTEVAAFEEEFAAYSGGRDGIAVNSGTSALHLALLAAGIGPTDEVITVPFTFVATVAAICYTGARPVFVDIEGQSYTMDPNRLEGVITDRTKAILPVHLYGQPADMDPILEIARRHGLLVIEDAAQAHGAEYKGRRIGSLGDLGCFSFYPSKNLGGYGEGGIVVTNDPDHAGTIRLLRDWGQERKHHHQLRGYNYRMDALQGAILRVKLRHLEAWTEARQARAARYTELLAGSGVQTPTVMPHCRHVYHIYAIRSPQRDVVQQALYANGIQTGTHYPTPIHLQPVYADLGYGPGDFPRAEQLAREQLSLPMYPELEESALKRIADCIRSSHMLQVSH
ncbi:MAG: DegT/DnrJ/EryC1/StrS family aminotransferase [Nitrospiraceae bacterium]